MKIKDSGYVVMYLAATVLANLSVAYFGVGAVIFNAFIFIGLDLTCRDALHDSWRGDGVLWKTALLVVSGSILSYALNRGAGQIALASFVAFASAGLVDSVVYHVLGDYPRWLRVNGSNVPSALVDSIVFPAIAFGFPLMMGVMVGQFVAKVAGGFFWSLVLHALSISSKQQAI